MMPTEGYNVMKRTIKLPIMGIVAFSSALHAIDNPHFYRATNLFLEPRLEHNYLTNLDITLGGGSTKKARNSNQNTVPLLDIYGTSLVQELGVDLPNKDLNNPYDLILTQLALLPQRAGFATFSIDGTFNIVESNISYTQNILKGFFLFFYLPIRNLQIKDIVFNDLSPDDDESPNKNTIAWQRFLRFFDPLLANYGVNRAPFNATGVGDLTTAVGWTHNYQDTKILDFIDGSFFVGVLAPTGKKKNEHQLFSLPLGYNGHWGFPICAMGSIGAFEWVTVGAYFNGLFFVHRDENMPLKTTATQSDFIKIAFGDVSVEKGTLWHAGAYFKADHFGHGLSFTAAYSYAMEQRSTLTPQNPAVFNYAIINSDQSLKKWSMHTLNFFAELDFTREDSKIGPRIGLFYNYQVMGKRTFKTNVVGGSFGIDIGW